MSKGASTGTQTPMAKAQQALAAAAQRGRGDRVEAGGETLIDAAKSRAQGAEHRADFNVGSVGTRRGRRGHRGIGQ